ncbi:MAG: 50S ribosomal protein L1 [Candidatus Omnitrophica bacterium]|nr:50S ribosomal protein L1 [Candidatus Omnitrophota bacterium]
MAPESKRMRKSREKVAEVQQTNPISLDQAVTLLKSLPQPKFDQTVEISVKLGVDPRKGDHMVRGSVSLPNGTGKTQRVAVFCEGDAAKQAEKAGADFVGGDDMIKKVDGGWLDFDVAIATPDMMSRLGRLGRVLGPRGLMPSPKAGTVTTDVTKAVTEFKAGRVEFRMDKTANLNAPVGKISFEEKAIVQNVNRMLEAIREAKPATAKGTYFQRISVSTTMGPGILLEIATA